MYLLDTNVVSEIRKFKSGQADSNVIKWATSAPAQTMYLSVISILEIELGILRIERKDNSQGQLLRSWLDNKIDLQNRL